MVDALLERARAAAAAIRARTAAAVDTALAAVAVAASRSVARTFPRTRLASILAAAAWAWAAHTAAGGEVMFSGVFHCFPADATGPVRLTVSDTVLQSGPVG
ncbi:hypothetical protein SUDANB106_00116 [Streptomyces sp. enrichment culture]|uniref:hypothetical protein n=1 Tax=Streptomyces sp. enrichment culture TaxID=1795815 RepID=UPI002186FC0A|nr:hypothetical protein LUW77_00260 [Streptomyces radiopugnans]